MIHWHFGPCLWSILFAEDPLHVSIVSRPEGPEILAADSASLSCQAIGGSGIYSYQWSSTCSGNCFLSSSNMASQTITRVAARSTDSGLYMCTVNDNAGNSGSNSTEIQIIGTTVSLANDLSLNH